MKIGIQINSNSFCARWIEYCKENTIPWIPVDCYRNDILTQLRDCDGLMWHFSHNNPKAALFARQLLLSVELSGKSVFPDFNTLWHFDDKVSQKYLLESLDAPTPDTWVFYEKQEAVEWINTTTFPKVFKLRTGAGSQNVRIIRSRREALKLTRKAFGKGFSVYDSIGSLTERFRLFRLGKKGIRSVLAGIIRLAIPPEYSRIKPRERGYIYFQEFIPGNDYDIRIIVIGDKAFGIKRMVRKNDFRASGSGIILYDRVYFENDTLEISFKLAQKLNMQCVAFDFIYQDGKPLVVEISFGFTPEGYDPCPGYWDRSLIWHEGKFNPYGWMIENLIARIKSRN